MKKIAALLKKMNELLEKDRKRILLTLAVAALILLPAVLPNLFGRLKSALVDNWVYVLVLSLILLFIWKRPSIFFFEKVKKAIKSFTIMLKGKEMGFVFLLLFSYSLIIFFRGNADNTTAVQLVILSLLPLLPQAVITVAKVVKNVTLKVGDKVELNVSTMRAAETTLKMMRPEDALDPDAAEDALVTTQSENTPASGGRTSFRAPDRESIGKYEYLDDILNRVGDNNAEQAFLFFKSEAEDMIIRFVQAQKEKKPKLYNALYRLSAVEILKRLPEYGVSIPDNIRQSTRLVFETSDKIMAGAKLGPDTIIWMSKNGSKFLSLLHDFWAVPDYLASSSSDGRVSI